MLNVFVSYCYVSQRDELHYADHYFNIVSEKHELDREGIELIRNELKANNVDIKSLVILNIISLPMAIS